jgi:hypothetical protein
MSVLVRAKKGFILGATIPEGKGIVKGLNDFDRIGTECVVLEAWYLVRGT